MKITHDKKKYILEVIKKRDTGLDTYQILLNKNDYCVRIGEFMSSDSKISIKKNAIEKIEKINEHKKEKEGNNKNQSHREIFKEYAKKFPKWKSDEISEYIEDIHGIYDL
jgi:hypothetical protein